MTEPINVQLNDKPLLSGNNNNMLSTRSLHASQMYTQSEQTSSYTINTCHINTTAFNVWWRLDEDSCQVKDYTYPVVIRLTGYIRPLR